MKLLFDENLPRRLIPRLAGMFPDSAHVTDLGLQRATDRQVWEHARRVDYLLVSKDSDFNDLAFVHGPPPKVVWLRVGNASTRQIEELLVASVDTISAFAANDTDAVLVLHPLPSPAENDAR